MIPVFTVLLRFYSVHASLYLRLTLFIIINGVRLRECLRTGHAWLSQRIGCGLFGFVSTEIISENVRFF